MWMKGVRLECKELMGIFWPQQVYDYHFGRKLGRRLQSVDVGGGVQRKGIVLGTDEGQSQGVWISPWCTIHMDHGT